MDELSPEAEAKDMELVATRGKEEQGSGWSFRRLWAETKLSGLCDDAGRRASLGVSAGARRKEDTAPILLPRKRGYIGGGKP